MLQPPLDDRLGTRRDRHQPLLAAFAEHHQERLVRPDRPARQAHELACAKARSVEQLEQCEVADRSRLAARGPVLSRLEHAPDLILVEDPRQWTFEAGPWKRGRRIVFAQTLVEQEAEEPTQRR